MAETTLTVRVNDKGVVEGIKQLKNLKLSADRVAVSIDRLKKNTDSVTARMLKMSSQIKQVGRDMTRYLTLPLVGAGAAGVKFALDLNKGMAQVQTLIPDTGDRIYELRDALRETAKGSGKTFDDLTSGLYESISAFQDGEDSVGRFNAAVNAGIAGGSTTKEAVKLLSAVTKAYGDTSTEAAKKVSDLAFEAVRLGQTTFPELASSMQIATDRATRLGISQEDLFTTFATLTGITGDASMVATQFRSAMDGLLAPTDSMKELFKELGVASGEALIQQEGFIGALEKVVAKSREAGRTLRDYITRKEGVTLVSQLAGNQLDVFNSKLEELTDYGGATAKALDAVKNGVNASGFALSKMKAEIIDAAVELGEMLIPYLLDLVGGLRDIVKWFTELNPAMQEFLLATAALAALAGPMLNFVGSLLKAQQVFLKLKAANLPKYLMVVKTALTGVSLASVGLVIGLGILIAIGIKVSKNYWEQENALTDLNKIKEATAELTAEESIALYKNTIELQRNKVAALEAANANIEKAKSLGHGHPMGFTGTTSDRLDEERAKLALLEKDYADFEKNLYERMETRRGMLPPPADYKTWQEHFERITGIAKESFKDSGAEAARLFVENLSKQTIGGQTLEQAEKYAEDIGEAFDPTPYIRKNIDTLEDALSQMLNIPADLIDEPFLAEFMGDATTDDSVQGILDALRLLYDQLEDLGGVADDTGEKLKGSIFFGAMGELIALDNYSNMLEKMGIEVDVTGDKLSVLEGALKEVAEGGKISEFELNQLLELFKELQPVLENTWKSFNENMRDFVVKGLQDLKIASEDVANEIANITDALVTMGVNSLNEGFSTLGRTIADATLEGHRFNDMLADQAMAILKALPPLMMQAGLNILSNDWSNPIGWGLVIAGGISSIIGGFVEQTLENAETTANAKGNVYSNSNIIPFRNGGAFSNSVVTQPTVFPFANGIGLMGEAGPEAIMPLTRTSSGELGVKAEGGSSDVSVIINNNTGEKVSTEERTNSSGAKELYITVGNVVKKQMNEGMYDKSMVNRYGVKARGLSA